MARVDFPEIQPGDALDQTVLNTAATALLTQSSNIDGDNVRDGGLDERNFADESVTWRPGTSVAFYTTGSSAIALGAAGANPIQVGGAYVDSGPYDYSPVTRLEKLLVKLSLHYQGVSPGTPGDAEFTFQLGYSTDWNPAGPSGTWTMIAATKRRVALRGYATAGTLSITHKFDQTIASATLWFGLFVWDNNAAGGNDALTIEDASLYGIIYKR